MIRMVLPTAHDLGDALDQLPQPATFPEGEL